MKPNFLFGFVLLWTASLCNAQIEQIDVKHYKVDLSVNDNSDTIEVLETISFSHLDEKKPIVFNLKSIDKNGAGMSVSKITSNDNIVQFVHKNDSLYVLIGTPSEDKYYEIDISFKGVPIDGLVIGENKFGKRTFFGDNWPNRAHNWFVCNDHLSDKASVEFIVHAPQKYTVVANGALISVQKRRKVKTFHYFSMVPIPTKVMVVGIAEFNIEVSGALEGTLVQSFTYPESKKEAGLDLSLAPAILDFYISYIAPYEFEKLDNVQSTTRFGGMENAGCIFYDEDALNGTQSAENLIAHEIVHQWFGNSATEKDWPHLWLSEGFATYLTNIYIEKTKGNLAFKDQLIQDRNKVVNFDKKYHHPLVDIDYKSLIHLLNPNSYQKGGWVLHMLRAEIGDELFQNCIQSYYRKYSRSNANSKDFQNVVEEVCNRDFSVFFNQWLHRAGHPKLQINSNFENRKLSLEINQKEGVFSFPMKVDIKCTEGPTIRRIIRITQETTRKDIVTSYPITEVIIDPEVELLYELVK